MLLAVVDERDIGVRPEHAALLALADKLDAERAVVRKAAEPLQTAAVSAIQADDLARAAELYEQIAALFREATFRGEAETYELRARDCRDALRRRKWIDKKRRGGQR